MVRNHSIPYFALRISHLVVLRLYSPTPFPKQQRINYKVVNILYIVTHNPCGPQTFQIQQYSSLYFMVLHLAHLCHLEVGILNTKGSYVAIVWRLLLIRAIFFIFSLLDSWKRKRWDQMHIGLPPMLTFHTVDKHVKMNNLLPFSIFTSSNFLWKKKCNVFITWSSITSL